jgi:hypothetical protein
MYTKNIFNHLKSLFLCFMFLSSFLYSLQSPAKLIVLNNDEYKLYKEYKNATKIKDKIDINSSILNIEKLLLNINEEDKETLYSIDLELRRLSNIVYKKSSNKTDSINKTDLTKAINNSIDDNRSLKLYDSSNNTNSLEDKESSNSLPNKRSNFIIEKSNKISDRNIDNLSNEELLDIRNQNILHRFNSSNEGYFTIPIALYSKTEYANDMILEYFNLDENVTYFNINIKDKNYIKVLYGIFKTKKEALDKLDFLYKKLSKILKPNDTKVYKIKKYKKYFN